jgi:hypothetical protein
MLFVPLLDEDTYKEICDDKYYPKYLKKYIKIYNDKRWDNREDMKPYDVLVNDKELFIRKITSGPLNKYIVKSDIYSWEKLPEKFIKMFKLAIVKKELESL